MRAPLAAVVGLLLVVASSLAQAQADRVPEDRQAAILVRALGYNRAQRANVDHFVIAVLAKSGDAESKRAGAAILTAFRAMASLAVKGLPIAVLSLDFTNADGLRAALAKEGVQALYVTPGLSEALPAVRAATRGAGVVSMAADGASVAAGLTLAVVPEGNRPRIIFNPEAAAAERCDFSSDLLALVKVVK
jgi:hypothetical protein